MSQKKTLTFAETQAKEIKKIAKTTVKGMQKLGIYKEEFDPFIEIYAGLCAQYKTISADFTESSYDFTELTETGSKKAPIVTTLESLRKDIIAYATALGLTPSGLRKINEKPLAPPRPPSPLDRMMDATPES